MVRHHHRDTLKLKHAQLRAGRGRQHVTLREVLQARRALALHCQQQPTVRNVPKTIQVDPGQIVRGAEDVDDRVEGSRAAHRAVPNGQPLEGFEVRGRERMHAHGASWLEFQHQPRNGPIVACHVS